MEVVRLSGSLGAEVRDVDLSSADASLGDEIKGLLNEHLVLFFPEQFLDPVEHIAFAGHFGKLEGHPNLKSPFSDAPEIFELAATMGGIADEWHSDITFQPQPSVMAILNMVQCPEVGGDTMWSNMYKAYDELSPPLRDLCRGLTALHDADPHGKSEQMTIHPVVRVHPVTRRESLFVNEHFTRRIVELSHEESAMLLGYLTSWVSNPRFTVRYHWSKGTIAMWDNRCTQHFVINDFDEERIIQRATIMGDEIEAAEPPRWEPYARSVKAGASSRHDRQINRHLGHRAQMLESNRKQGGDES
ncbi:MAG: TauD/TfdA family dioxygenase [Deltaproteobacteria bacterium]|nr:TauD/TfdA family dioxygenase [Deltaproteobacteria bacterium]